jgi:hypothetical protein
MSRHKKQEVESGRQAVKDAPQDAQASLREYRVPWDGPLLLACSECGRKLKGCGADFIRPKKWLKKRRKHDPSTVDVKVIGVSCLKVCPKGGVTMLAQRQMVSVPARMVIVSSDGELESLYRQMLVAG